MGAEIREREVCPNCEKTKGRKPTRNNLAIYRDGKFCLACGYTEKEDKQDCKESVKEETMGLVAGAHVELADRKISLDTAVKYNVRTCEFSGYISKNIYLVNEIIRIFPIYENGKVVKQKLKAANDKRKQSIAGQTKCQSLFGMQTTSPNKKIPIIITEGEEDALAAYQMMGYPAVSITSGASSAKAQVTENLEWLSGFAHVVLCFDNDDEGRKATDACAALFEPGTVRVASLPVKDANDMLRAGKSELFKKAIWSAALVKPPTLVFPKDIIDKVLKKPEYGIDWPFPTMTKVTFGFRFGESYILAGATGVGKTEILKKIISWMIAKDVHTGYFCFEQSPDDTMRRLIGGIINERIHLPGCKGWNDEKIKEEYEKIQEKIVLYDPSSGAVTLDSVLINIRYLNKACGTRFFVIDNLKAMSINPVIDGKRCAVHDYMSHCMGYFTALCKELSITIFVLNHLAIQKIGLSTYVGKSKKDSEMSEQEVHDMLNKPGLTYETGRVPTIESIYGGGAVRDLTDWIIVISRNRMSKNKDDHRTTWIKFLKTRFESSHEGLSFPVQYDYKTGDLVEVILSQSACDNYEKASDYDIENFLG